MRRYLVLAVAIAGAFLALFLIAGALDLPLVSDPLPVLRRAGAFGAAAGVALLVLDVFLPVPSSLVMVGLGAVYGFVPGALLGWAGSLGAAALAFACGRRGEALVGRLVSAQEKRRADAWLARWGAAAIVCSRPIPLVAETVAILAGASPLRWRTLLAAAAAGTAPPAAVYAAAGALAPAQGQTALAFGLVVLVSGVPWWLGMRARRAPALAPEAVTRSND